MMGAWIGSKLYYTLSRSRSANVCSSLGPELYNTNDSSADDDNVKLCCQLHVSWMHDKNDMKYGVCFPGEMVPRRSN